MKFYNGGCRREESLGNGFYLIQIKKILLCRRFAQQTLRATSLTGNICPRDSDKFYLIQISLSPESRVSELEYSNVFILPLNPRLGSSVFI